MVRSDGSGTTAQFTTWMDNQYPSLWRPFCSCKGLTSYYPIKDGIVAKDGSVGVAGHIAASYGNGTIGYVEYSYALNDNYPVAKVLNKAGYYVLPTAYNVAVALTQAKINQDKSSPLYLTQILTGVYNYRDPRTYPLSSYSYMIVPTGKDDPRMNDEQGEHPGRLRLLLPVRRATRGARPRLLPAAVEPGRRPASPRSPRYPNAVQPRPQPVDLQQPDVRPEGPRREPARRDRPAAAGL